MPVLGTRMGAAGARVGADVDTGGVDASLLSGTVVVGVVGARGQV